MTENETNKPTEPQVAILKALYCRSEFSQVNNDRSYWLTAWVDTSPRYCGLPFIDWQLNLAYREYKRLVSMSPLILFFRFPGWASTLYLGGISDGLLNVSRGVCCRHIGRRHRISARLHKSRRHGHQRRDTAKMAASQSMLAIIDLLSYTDDAGHLLSD